MSDQPVDLNLEEIKELIKLLRESNISEFEIRRADYRLRIKQGYITESIPATVSPSNGKTEALPAVTEPSGMEVQPEAAKEVFHEIRSPMVGTFYRSSSPGAAPFVQIGDQVRKGQVLCIIEAMKIMNEIESDIDGEVQTIHPVNGQPVEFGDLLFSIKPLS